MIVIILLANEPVEYLTFVYYIVFIVVAIVNVSVGFLNFFMLSKFEVGLLFAILLFGAISSSLLFIALS